MMKKYLFLLCAGCLGLAACQSNTSKIRDFIPGTYVCSAKSEFSIANDTLIIGVDEGLANAYVLTRKTGYRLLVNGQPAGLHYKIKRWTATWNQASSVLTVLQTGKAIRFLPDQHGLVNGNSRYRKL
jgi:hypothetical protein